MKHTGIRYLAALPLALAAIATAAVELSHDGRGDVLLYPFYSAEGGNDTYISVANNTDQPKALRVRFREGVANAEVLSFNLYLGARDHWAGAVTTTSQNGARLISSDESCTYPEQPVGGFVFSDANYADDDYYFNGIERTREGMVEIIEMGILDDDSENGSFGAVEGIFGEGIGMHGFGLSPPPFFSGCVVVSAAWEWSVWESTNDRSRNISAATGGLSGYGVVINVSEGTNITYNATALKKFFDGGFLHSHPDDTSPSLADAAPVARIYHHDHGVIELETETGVDAVSSILIRSEIGSDLVMASSINASTEWVINFPLRQYHELSSSSYSSFYLQMKVWDRQGGGSFANDLETVLFAVCSPGNYDIVLSNAVNILEFARLKPILGASSKIARSIAVEQDIENGHAILDLSTYNFCTETQNNETTFDTDQGTITLAGIPVIGFAVQKYVNGNVNGVLSNYTGTQSFHTTLAIETHED